MAGGLEEALLLVTGPLDGWASRPVNGTAIGQGQALPWGLCWRAEDDAGAASDPREIDADVEEAMSPQVDLLCALLVRHHSGTAPGAAATCAKPGDGKKVLACMDKVLEAAKLAVQARAQTLGECFGEE